MTRFSDAHARFESIGLVSATAARLLPKTRAATLTNATAGNAAPITVAKPPQEGSTV